MKKLILLSSLLLTSHTYAYQKPQLVARLGDIDSWNAPVGTWCFFSEPSLINNRIYLPCFDMMSNLMASWDSQNEYTEVARADYDYMFSKAVNAYGKASWFEYNQFEVTRAFEDSWGFLTEIPLGGLTGGGDFNSNFLPMDRGSYFFQVKGVVPRLMKWDNGPQGDFFAKNVAHIFTPQVSSSGEVAFKTREGGTAESFPDKIWLYKNGSWKVIFEDNDANPKSTWLSFRHQLSVSDGKVVTVATSVYGESLILIDKFTKKRKGESDIKIIALRGVDLKNFDFFTVKMHKNVIAFRGEDLEGRKAVYVYTNNKLTKLITQGDIVQTDVGPGKIHYKNQDSIFYGAPGIGDSGEIIQQVTLTDPDFPTTLLGIGLIKVQK